ncbi:MAG TPA: hypothetical protein VKO84_03410 [Gaiellaceae bacterium]|nr:hypothetical protein [Gaiellaceae bacterium]
MRRGLIGSAVTALVLAGPAAAGLPKAGALVPGRSLGGIRLGETPRAVRAALGRNYGMCRGCSRTTWYFTYRPFSQQGLAVEFGGTGVSAVYTLWRPQGWYAPHGLRFGATPLTVHARVGSLQTISCSGYTALVRDTFRARTAYFVYGGRLWGFGLFRRGATPCR